MGGTEWLLTRFIQPLKVSPHGYVPCAGILERHVLSGCCDRLLYWYVYGRYIMSVMNDVLTMLF